MRINSQETWEICHKFDKLRESIAKNESQILCFIKWKKLKILLQFFGKMTKFFKSMKFLMIWRNWEWKIGNQILIILYLKNRKIEKFVALFKKIENFTKYEILEDIYNEKLETTD